MLPGKVIDLRGKSFERLTVLDFVGIENHNAVWLCLCFCGKTIKRQGGQLRAGHQKSCGCLGAKRRPYESLFNALKYTAKRRAVRCLLAYEDFLTFTRTSKCGYCGDSVLWKPFSDNKTSRHNLDRKNNDLGYTIDNCVVCCYSCNMTKGDRFTHAEFMRIAPILRSIHISRRNYEQAP